MAQTHVVSEYKLENGIRVLIAPRPGCGAIHAAWFIEGGRRDTGGYPPETADLLSAAWFTDSDLSGASGLWMKVRAGGMSFGRDIPAEALEAWCQTEMRRFTQALRQEQIDGAKRSLQTRWQEPDPMTELYTLIPSVSSRTAHESKNTANLAPISISDLQTLASKYAVADRVSIVLVGDVEDASAISTLNACFSRLESPDAQLPRITDAPQSADSGQQPSEERKREISSETRTEVLAAWPVTLYSNNNKPSLELFAEILAGGPDSYLNRYLVTELGCSNGAQASVDVSGEIGAGLFVVRADVAEGHTVHEVESAIQSEVQLSLHSRLHDTDINRAAQRLETKFAVRLADASSLAQALIDSLESAGDWSLAIERTSGGVSLEPQELTYVLRSVFQPDSGYSLLVEQDPIRSPRSRDEARLVSLLVRLLENKVKDSIQREKIIRETVRQFWLTPGETRGQLLSLLEAKVGY